MAVDLKTIASGYSTGLINENFQQIADLLNNNFLNRDGVEDGEDNQMEVDLDMNGFSILNVAVDITDPDSLVNKGYVDSYNNIQDAAIAAATQVSNGDFTELSEALVTTSEGESRQLQDYLSKSERTFDTLADAQNDTRLVVGTRVTILGNEEAFDGGGCKLDVVASGGEITLTNSGLTANRVDPRVVSRASVEHLLDVTPHDGLTVSIGAYHSSYGSKELLGGGLFRYDASISKSSHDGGLIISPTVPWDWSDNGEAFLAGDDDTDPSGTGCWIRAYTGTSVTPLMYGAKADSGPNYSDSEAASDDTVSIQAALKAVAGSKYRSQLDLGGRYYAVSDTIATDTTMSYASNLTLRNGYLRAKSTFAGDYMFDFTVIGSSGTGTMFNFVVDNVRLAGGPAGSDAHVEGMFSFAQVGNLDFTNLYAVSFTGSCIKATDDGPANGIVIRGGEMNGLAGYNPNAVGIELSGNDSEIVNNTVYNCKTGYYLGNGACSVVDCHPWRCDQLIDARKASQLIINDNYFDGGTIRIVAPINTQICNNKFLIPTEDAAAMFADDRGIIELAPDGEDYVIENLIITGNTGKVQGSDTLQFIKLNQTASESFAGTSSVGLIVEDNVIEGPVTMTASRAKKQASVSNSGSVTIDFGDELIFTPNWAHSVILQGSGGSINRVSRSGSVFTVQFGNNATGTVTLEASCGELVM